MRLHSILVHKEITFLKLAPPRFDLFSMYLNMWPRARDTACLLFHLPANLERNPVWAPVWLYHHLLKAVKSSIPFGHSSSIYYTPMISLDHILLCAFRIQIASLMSRGTISMSSEHSGKILHKSSSSLDNSGDCGY